MIKTPPHIRLRITEQEYKVSMIKKALSDGGDIKKRLLEIGFNDEEINKIMEVMKQAIMKKISP